MAAKVGEGSRRRTVLVVDDQPDVLSALSVFLRYSIKELEVRAAPSAAAALDVLQKEPVDLVVADYRMPGMDGFSLLEAVGRIAPGIPRILLTAHWDEATKADGRAKNADRLLPKSVALEELAAHVEGFLRGPTPAPTAAERVGAPTPP